MGPLSWPRGCASAGLIGGLLVCNSTSEPVHAEAAHSEENQEDPSVTFSHGKKVYTDYSITGEQNVTTTTCALFLFYFCASTFSINFWMMFPASVI